MTVRFRFLSLRIVSSVVLPLAGLAGPALIDTAHAADVYAVKFTGADNSLLKELKLLSQLARTEQYAPTKAALGRLARQDSLALKKGLRAAGYYNGKVAYTINDTGQGPPIIVFSITPGTLFQITEYRLLYTNPLDTQRPDTLSALNIKGDGKADGASLLALQQQALEKLRADGFPFARMTTRRVEATYSAGTATALFNFDSGPKATFGGLEIKGDPRTKASYLEALTPWAEGAPYNRSALVKYREKLAATGLFNELDVAPGEPDADGRASVIVEVEERKRRTIGAGASYSTSKGPGGRLFFEYRNLFGAAEKARAEIELSQIEQSFAFTLDKPLPTLPGALFGKLGVTNEQTDAYDALTVSIGAGLSKSWFDNRLKTRGAGNFETSRITRDNISERTYLMSLPLSAIWDTEDDPLVLSKGMRAAFSVTPFFGSDQFVKSELTVRTRKEFGTKRQFAIAARTRFGGIFGTSSLPINQRFYAGGGSSVRGYEYQKAGPLDADGDPIGGRSVIDAAVEARYKIAQNIQLAGFADAGTIGESSLPDFGGSYFTGVGGGIRYFTPIGPIRADVGIPLNKRPQDANFQLYISLGQSF